MSRRVWLAIAAVGMAVVAAGCDGDSDAQVGPPPDAGLRIASFDFAESELLAEMYAQIVESTGTPVIRVGAVGPREIIAPAIELDRIDFIPEYLGTALRYAGAPLPNPNTPAAVSDLNTRLSPRRIVALDAALAQNKNVFVVTRELATSDSLVNISDLAGSASELVLGGPAECPSRDLCLAGLESTYGLQFAEFTPQRSLVFTAEALRRSEIDVGVMFSTAAPLEAVDLVELVDDRHLQPAENIVPIVRADAVERWGEEMVAAVNAMSGELSTSQLRMLNARVAVGESVEDVARDWLAAHGFVRSW